jgi:hypothetical protein
VSAGNGWIGTNGQILHFLRVVGADQDSEGRFIITGEGVISFMGMGGEDAECIVPAATCYRKGGRDIPLAAGLAGTSYGLGITVIA